MAGKEWKCFKRWGGRAAAVLLCAALAAPAPAYAQARQPEALEEGASEVLPLADEQTGGADLVIANVNDWAEFVKGSYGDGYTGKLVKLAADLDFTGVTFDKVSADFNGEFDGCGHSILIPSGKVVFETIKTDGIVKNLTVTASDNYNASICSSNYGLIDNCCGRGVGDRNYGVIINCRSVVYNKGWSTGGIVRYNYGKLYNSCNFAEASNGICDWASGSGSQIENCFNAGMVEIGIAEEVKDYASIRNVYSALEAITGIDKELIHTKTPPFDVTACEALPAATMKSAEFVARLNANREGHPDWLEWELRAGESEYPLPIKRVSLDTQCQVDFGGATEGTPSFAYDGDAKEPEVTVMRNGTALVNGKDYILTYKNNVDAGTATAVVKGIGNYMDVAALQYPITPVDLSSASVTVQESGLVYDGSEKTPALTVRCNGRTLAEGTDYTVQYSDNLNAGTGKAAVTGTGNYTGSVEPKEFTIAKADREIQAAESYEKMGGDPEFSLDVACTGDGALTYASSNEDVVQVDGAGKVAIQGAGVAELTVSAPETANYKAKEIKITVTVRKLDQTLEAEQSYTKVYGDAEFSLDVTHDGDGALTYASSNPSVASVDNTGKVSVKGAGTAEITVRAAETAGYNGKEIKIAINIQKASQSLEAVQSYTKTYGDKEFLLNVRRTGDGALTYASSNPNVASVDNTGKVSVKGAGTAEITVQAAETANYTGKEIKVAVNVQKAAQSLAAKGEITKTYGAKAFRLNVSHVGDGKLAYGSSDKKVAVVDKAGKVTVKGTGIAVITVTAQETNNYCSASRKITVKVNPKKMAVKSVKAQKGKKLSVNWKKDAKATGYELQYSTDKKFKKGVKAKKVSKGKTTSYTITKLKPGKQYYVRIRAVKSAKLNGKKVSLNGAWSSAKRSPKVKK